VGSLIAQGAAIVGLLLVSALLSAAETGLAAADPARLQELAQEGDRRAALALRLRERREEVFGTLVLGKTLATVLASAIAVATFNVGPGAGPLLATAAVLAAAMLVFCEAAPRLWALGHADRTALALAPALSALLAVLGPVARLAGLAVGGLMRLFGGVVGEGGMAGRQDELRGAIELHAGAEEETRHERAMLRSILDLGDVEVGEIMVHRRNVSAMDIDLGRAAVVKAVLESPYTRMPLWRGEPDNIVGVLHAKDLLRALQARAGNVDDVDVLAIAAKPWFIPDTTSLLGQLQAFRSRHEHFALVVDEYGSLQGVVTLEDILEEIVGDIADEHDVPVAGVRAQPGGSWIVDGTVTLRDLKRQFEWRLPDEEASTIAGLVLHEARRIPEVGQVFAFHGFRFEILRRQRNQITSIRVTPPAEAPAPAAADSA
jgi:Mg2+/Co2+ transporter CorB